MSTVARTIDFLDLPSDCFSRIFMSSPRDACVSSTISSAFRSVADSDEVWDRFLPSDYQEILSKCVSPVRFSSKKELYFRLCDSVLIDSGNKVFSLERWSGKKSYVVGARDLSIVWGNDRRYWKWKPHHGSRFSKVAKLQYVWWLDIHGKIDASLLSPRTNYVAYLIVTYIDQDMSWWGLDVSPAEVSVEVGNHVKSNGMARLCPENVGRPFEEVVVKVPRERGDGWMEIELGEFYNSGGEEGEVVKMGMKQVDCSYSKEGLVIEGIEIRPKV
ncbi:hypothetical protein Syun_007966 [Stephania yunnanensis]|uniref:F-box domain-containing protein n=1 Tax=Stephania yunnanensis TaxID=152371 RepID=A0AAP0L208_9MAGN